jgi:NAD(P)-dependent dehydrogenase (short-subunit alcohol dehydrogenase family)
MRLKDKVALITGGNSGIGLATARLFAQEGAGVIITGRDQSRGEAAVEEIINQGGRACFIQAEVSDEGQVQKMAEQAAAWGEGRIDILFNNAGIILFGDATEMSLNDWERLMSINVRGVFLCTKYVAPFMIKQKSGAIINMASNLGLIARERVLAYCASKGAVIQMTRAMSLDYIGYNIRVNCVCPATIETPLVLNQRIGLTAEQLAQSDIRLKQRHPIGRMGQPEEVARAVLFLASDESSFITGTALSVDGGYTAQ